MAAEQTPPYASYAGIMGTFLGGVAMTGFLATRLRRNLPELSAFDLALLGLATFKASRTFARDEVTSFLREPFVVGKPSDPEDERPLPSGGTRQAIGELVTCSRCIGTWAAAGIVGLDVLTPRFGRMLTLSLAVGGVNDWLQAGFATLTDVANKLEAG
jgi:hypothetical protein